MFAFWEIRIDMDESIERGNDMDYSLLGRQIRQQRQKQNMTQEKLAEKAKISASFLGHIERGSRKASVETILNIAGALSCSLDELFVGNLYVRDMDGDYGKALRAWTAVGAFLEKHRDDFHG